MGIREGAAVLAGELMRSSEFGALKQAKAVIDKDGSLRKEMDVFTGRQKELLYSRLSDQERVSRMGQQRKHLEDLSKIPEMKRYLEASKAFSELASEAMKMVQASVEASLK